MHHLSKFNPFSAQSHAAGATGEDREGYGTPVRVKDQIATHSNITPHILKPLFPTHPSTPSTPHASSSHPTHPSPDTSHCLPSPTKLLRKSKSSQSISSPYNVSASLTAIPLPPPLPTSASLEFPRADLGRSQSSVQGPEGGWSESESDLEGPGVGVGGKGKEKAGEKEKEPVKQRARSGSFKDSLRGLVRRMSIGKKDDSSPDLRTLAAPPPIPALPQLGLGTPLARRSEDTPSAGGSRVGGLKKGILRGDGPGSGYTVRIFSQNNTYRTISPHSHSHSGSASAEYQDAEEESVLAYLATGEAPTFLAKLHAAASEPSGGPGAGGKGRPEVFDTVLAGGGDGRRRATGGRWGGDGGMENEKEDVDVEREGESGEEQRLPRRQPIPSSLRGKGGSAFSSSSSYSTASRLRTGSSTKQSSSPGHSVSHSFSQAEFPSMDLPAIPSNGEMSNLMDEFGMGGQMGVGMGMDSMDSPPGEGWGRTPMPQMKVEGKGKERLLDELSPVQRRFVVDSPSAARDNRRSGSEEKEAEREGEEEESERSIGMIVHSLPSSADQTRSDDGGDEDPEFKTCLEGVSRMSLKGLVYRDESGARQEGVEGDMSGDTFGDHQPPREEAGWGDERPIRPMRRGMLDGLEEGVVDTPVKVFREVEEREVEPVTPANRTEKTIYLTPYTSHSQSAGADSLDADTSIRSDPDDLSRPMLSLEVFAAQEAEKEAIKQQRDLLRDLCGRLQVELEEREGMVEALRREGAAGLGQREGALRVYEGRVEEMRGETNGKVKGLLEECQKLQQQIEDATAERSRDTILGVSQPELDSALARELEAARSENRDLQIRMEGLQRQLRQGEEERDGWERAVGEMRVRLKAVERERGDLVARERDEEIRAQGGKVGSVETEQLKEDNSTLRENLRELRNRLEDQVNEQKRLKALQVEMEGRLEDAEGELEEVRGQQGEENMRDELEQARGELESVTEQLQTLQIEMNALETTHAVELARLGQDAASKINEASAAWKAQEETALENGRLSAQLKVANGKRQQAEERADAMKKKMSASSELLEQVSRQSEQKEAQMQRELEESDREVEDLRKALQEAQEERDRATTSEMAASLELDRLRSQVEAMTAEAQQIKKEALDLRQSSASKEVELSQLHKFVEQLKEDKEMLNIALDSKQQELEIVKRRFSVRGLAGTTPMAVKTGEHSMFEATPNPTRLLSNSTSGPNPAHRRQSSAAAFITPALGNRMLHRSTASAAPAEKRRSSAVLGSSVKHNSPVPESPKKKSMVMAMSPPRSMQRSRNGSVASSMASSVERERSPVKRTYERVAEPAM